jgi:hypothetical protein
VKRDGAPLDTRVAGKGYVIAWQPDKLRTVAEWAMAPEWVYQEPKRGAPATEAGKLEAMGTRDEIVSWLGTIAAHVRVTESEYRAMLYRARADGRIVELDSSRPWTDADLDKLACEAAKWEPNVGGRLIVSAKRKGAHEEETSGTELIVGIEAYRHSVPAVVPWIAERFVYAGGTTLLSGPPKKGKSTFSADLQRKRETGGRFLHAGVLPGPTLLLTEEGGIAVTFKTAGLERLHILDRRAASRVELDWPGTLGVVERWATDNWTDHGRPLVFIDTLAIWAGVDDENSSGEMTRALAQVQLVAQETESGIVVVHHTRKGGGTGGEAIRGSSAILATVDMSAELSVVEEGSTDRWLDIQGRVVFPERLRLTFDPATMEYSVVDLDKARLEDIERDLEHIPLVGNGDGLSRDDLSELWGKDPRKRADQLVNLGRLKVERRKVERAYRLCYWAIPPAGPCGPSASREEDDDD